MPVSFIPVFNLMLSVILFVTGGYLQARHHEKRQIGRGLVIAGSVVLLGPPLSLRFISTGLWVMATAENHSAQFQYARWLESIPDISEKLTLFPCGFDFESSWYWLCRAADGGEPEAQYARGIRLKYDEFVPASETQREKGQKYIDAAFDAGYIPLVAEQDYYYDRFRITF